MTTTITASELIELIPMIFKLFALGIITVAVGMLLFLLGFLWYETRRRCRFQRLRRLWVTARWGRHE